MDPNTLPNWVASLDEEDLHFVRRFMLASGSLKALASEYGVSYPTLRGRLDRLIAKIQTAEDPALQDPFRRTIQLMVADGQLTAESARRLMKIHKDSLSNKENGQ